MTDIRLIDYDGITCETWRRWNTAADDPSHPMRLFTLATVDGEGKPDARMLILRGASREHSCLWFHTDRRSKKVPQVVQCPHVCALAYDHRDGVQLRVWGGVTLHSNDQLAERHWEQTDFHVRHANALSLPGRPLPQRDPRWEAHLRQLDAHNETDGRQDFVVLELDIERIEWLQVGPGGGRRAVMRSATGWQIKPLVP